MKFDKYKTFPHPVLRPFSDDYVSSEIQAAIEKFELGTEPDTVSIKCRFNCSSSDLNDLVESGRACYAMMISCRDTFYREIVTNNLPELCFATFTGNLRGEVRIDTYIIACVDIHGFSSSDFNPEYGDENFSVRNGDVLAQDETKVYYIERESFKPVTSSFELVVDDSLGIGEWAIGLGGDKVQIRMHSEMKQTVDKARNVSEAKAVLLNSVYFATVIHAVQAIKDKSVNEDARWVRGFNQQIANTGSNIEADDAYIIAQRLLQKPLNKLKKMFFDKA